MLTNKSFAVRNGYTVNPNQDFIALGAADVMSGLSQGFVMSGADSRTAVNNSAGGKTQLVSVFAAITIVIILIFFTGYLSLLPITVLSAIIISASIGLFNFEYLKKLFRVSRKEFRLSVLTSLCVITIGVFPAVIIAVAISLLKLLGNASKPKLIIMGKSLTSDTYHDVEENKDAVTVPDVLVVGIESSLVYFNADYFKNSLMEIIMSEKKLSPDVSY